MNDSCMPLAELQSVTYTHWNQNKPTIKELSLTLGRGELVILVGPGSSGKSTLCDLFNGKIPHILGGKLEGDVWIDGINTRKVSVKDLASKVGQVLQDPETMFATLTVEDEIAFGPENLRLDPSEIRTIVDTLLETTQLTPFRDHLVWNLSGGQVQKLALAAVLAMRPSLIVLDEPTSNLDPASTYAVHDLVLSLRDQGKTILFVTRELNEFLDKADRLLVLHEGHLLADDSPKRVLWEHGDEMQSLGIWLPETSEIALSLQKTHSQESRSVPITVQDTLIFLQNIGLFGKKMISVPLPLSEKPPVQRNPLIIAKDLTYTYSNGVKALRGISLEIQAGELLAIVGRNGAGKSTLAKLMVGLLKPQGGELILFGKPATKWKIEELANHISLVFQNPEHQFLTDRVADEIGYSLLARGINDPKTVRKITQEFLEMLGLDAVAELHPFALSAGMKRRLGVATMLVGSPKVLMVDEPTYGQDKQMTQTLMKIMKGLCLKGIAVVMITHDMRLVQEYAERVIVMSEGLIYYDGTPAGLFEKSDILEQANLRPTLLHQLVQAIPDLKIADKGQIRTTKEFVEMLQRCSNDTRGA